MTKETCPGSPPLPPVRGEPVEPWTAAPGWLARVLLIGLRGYQLLLSPLLGNRCRFYPSCSHYAMEAITRHGVRRGAGLTVRRLLRCHPFHPGGCDPVP